MTKASSVLALSLLSAGEVSSSWFPQRKPVPQAKVSFLRKPAQAPLARSRVEDIKVRFLRNGCPWPVWYGKSEVFTHCEPDLFGKVKKVLGTKVRFLRIPFPWPNVQDAISKSELFTQLAKLVARACISSPYAYLRSGKSEVSTQSRLRVSMLNWLEPKVWFFRTPMFVTHCVFVIYKKVSLA
jgi:hypothetical protein